MRFLVLGGGTQGSAAAWALLQEPDVEEVVVADLVPGEGAPFLRPHRGGRLRFVAVDATREAEVRGAMEGMDAVLCALPYPFNFEMARLAIGAGAHFADLGGNTRIVAQQRTLDVAAVGARVSVIPDCGLAPGIVNILAQGGIEGLDRTDSVRMWVGGLPQHPTPPLNYRAVYSLEGVLDYYTTPGIILRDGEPVEVQALTGLERVSFPEPIGELEAFYTAGGASTLPERYQGRIPTLEYRTLRYPGHAQIMAAFRDLGFFEETPVEVDGADVVPRRLFVRLASEALRRGDARDLVILRVEARGVREGEAVEIRYELLEYFDEALGMSAMMRCTGFALAVVGLLQARGQIAGPGVRTGDEVVRPDRFIAELAGRGIEVRRTESRGARRSESTGVR